MKVMKILCAGLVAAMMFTGCKAVENGASDLGSDISSGISDVESGVSSGMSNLESDVSSGISDGKSDLSSAVSDEKNKNNNSSESAPASGASSEVPAEIHVSPATVDLSSLECTSRDGGKASSWTIRIVPSRHCSFRRSTGNMTPILSAAMKKSFT